MKFSPGIIRIIMDTRFHELRESNLTRAANPQSLYSFSPEDVALIHFSKQGAGSGIWFRLEDVRVFDAYGKPSQVDPGVYDAALSTECNVRRNH